MAESIYNSEEYLSNSISPYCNDCELNCQGCENCECTDQGGEADCSASCQCSIEGCQYCDTCQTSCEKSCQSCNTCQTTCQTSCQCSAEGCQSCNTCQCVVEGCESCQTTCQTICQTSCELACQSTCEKSCQSCNTCQDTCETACQDTCQKACQTCLTVCNNCQTECQKACQCSAEGCQSCNTCQCSVEGCETCQDACESACQNDQCYECQASCQICNSKQSHCAKNKQGLTQHIGSMSVPTVGQKVRTKDYTDIATYLNNAIAVGKWSLSLLPTEVAAGSPINRSTLDTFISYVRTISGSYLNKTDSKISVSDISTLKGYLDGTNIPDTIPCCENTGYESCVTEQCAASKCQDNRQ